MVLLAILVVPLVLVFGLSTLVDQELTAGMVPRMLSVVALWVMPVVFAAQIRSRGGWVAAAGALGVAGAMLIVVVPVLVGLPGFVSSAVIGALIGGSIGLGRHLAKAAVPVDASSAPARPDTWG